MRLAWHSIIAAAVAFVSPAAYAYDRTAALDYASNWCQTDKNGDGKVDFVNSPARGGPYTWFYHVKLRLFGYEFYDTRITRQNDGDNSKLAEDGFDCTNFASQSLKAGGLPISGTGPGGTIIRVRQLAEFLRPISEVTTLASASSPLPANLAVGDIIELRDLHMTFVASVNPLKLVFHSNDRCPADNVSLANFGAGAFPATVFHIVGASVGSLESTPPTIAIVTEGGNTVAPEKATNARSLTVQAADSGSGLRGLHLTRGTPLVDRLQDFTNGAGSYIFADDSSRGGNFSYSLPQDLAEGLYFVEAFDGAGNYSMQPVGIDRTKPALNVFANGSPVAPGGATSGSGLSFVADDTTGGTAVLVSGLARLEIYKGDPTTGGTLLASNAVLYESTHTYTASDDGLTAMNSLPEGDIFVRVVDQAGNDTSVNLTTSPANSSTRAA